jgi:hypothetical protein
VAQKKGLDWIIITDHNHDVEPGEWGKTMEICDDKSASSFLCFRGTEAGRWWWEKQHALGYGSPHLGVNTDSPPGDVDSILDYGGIAFIAHPYSIFPFIGWDSWDEETIAKISGIEIWNYGEHFHDPDTTSKAIYNHLTAERDSWVELLLDRKRVSAIGNSDAHYAAHVGAVMTACQMPFLDRDHVIDALKKGRCFVSNGPFLSLKGWETQLQQSQATK